MRQIQIVGDFQIEQHQLARHCQEFFVGIRAAECSYRLTGHIADGLHGFFSTSARLQLVAEPQTALLVSRLVGDYGELLFELLTYAQPAHLAGSDIRLADLHYGLAQWVTVVVARADGSSFEMRVRCRNAWLVWQLKPGAVVTVAYEESRPENVIMLDGYAR